MYQGRNGPNRLDKKGRRVGVAAREQGEWNLILLIDREEESCVKREIEEL